MEQRHAGKLAGGGSGWLPASRLGHAASSHDTDQLVEVGVALALRHVQRGAQGAAGAHINLETRLRMRDRRPASQRRGLPARLTGAAASKSEPPRARTQLEKRGGRTAAAARSSGSNMRGVGTGCRRSSAHCEKESRICFATCAPEHAPHLGAASGDQQAQASRNTRRRSVRAGNHAPCSWRAT